MITSKEVLKQGFERGGGLNTLSDPFALTENESPNSIDVLFSDDGSRRKRYGVELLNKTPTGASNTCQGLFDYGVSPGVRKLVGEWGTTLYKMDDLDGTWDSLETSRTDCPHYFERSGTKLIICNEQRDTVKYWDGTAASLTTLNTSAPLARIPKPFQGYLFLANTSSSPRRIYYEDESTITTGDYAEYLTLPSSNDDEVLILIEYNGRLYVSLRSEWYRISYIGGTAVFDYKRVSSIVGAVPKTIQLVSLPNMGEVMMYLGWNKKIYIFDGTSSYSISEKYEKNNDLCPVYLDAINQGGLGNSHAVVDVEKNLYRLYVPIGGSSTITHSFNISLNSLSCSVFASQEYSASCIAEDSNKKRWHIVGGYDGSAYKTDRASYDEVPLNNAAIGTDAASMDQYIAQASLLVPRYMSGCIHDGGDNVTVAEDATYNYTTSGIVVGDYVKNRTDGEGHVTTAINNGGGTNAQLDYANAEGDTDNNDEFDVYKTAFIADNDNIYLGSSRKFNVINISLLVNSSHDVGLKIYYSTSTAGTYTEITNFTDTTVGFTKSGTITFNISSSWAVADDDDSNNAFNDTTDYYYIRLSRTTNTVTTKPVIANLGIGVSIDDYYTSPKVYGRYITALKKGLRMFMYFDPVANYNCKLYDRKDFETDWTLRDNIPMYNKGDNFLGQNFILNSNKLGSRQDGVERSIDVPVVTNSYQYKLTSNKSVNLPWKLHTVELVERSTGIGASTNKMR